MIHTRQPQHFEALHTRASRENILDSIVENVAKRKHAGDVWRRHHDRERGFDEFASQRNRDCPSSADTISVQPTLDRISSEVLPLRSIIQSRRAFANGRRTLHDRFRLSLVKGEN